MSSIQHLNSQESDRPTSNDVVFDTLRNDILTLKLLPGTKMSEAEVAERFGVSRQPVRVAFNRLDHLDLLTIRPQRATVVRGFSIAKIAEARFLRLAAEIEVVRRACLTWDDNFSEKTMVNLQQQLIAAEEQRWDHFHGLDLQFHLLICKLSGCHYAINTIKFCRQKTDRLCVLSFNREREVDSVIDEHRQLITALDKHDDATATDIVRVHLGRLDSVVREIRIAHSDYFE